MFNVKRYAELKEKGLIRLHKIGNAFAASWKRFDELTGEEVETVSEAFDTSAVEQLTKESTVLLRSIETLLADMSALKEK